MSFSQKIKIKNKTFQCLTRVIIIFLPIHFSFLSIAFETHRICFNFQVLTYLLF